MRIDRTFISNLSWNYGAQTGIVALGFVFMFLTTSHCGIEVYGAFALLRSLTGLLGAFMSFRTSEALVRYYGRGQIDTAPDECKRAMLMSLILDCAVAIVSALALIAFAPAIAQHYLHQAHYSRAVSVYAIYLFIIIVQASALGFLQAEERLTYFGAVRLLEQLVRVALLLPLMQAFKSADLYGVVLACLIGAALATVLAFRPFAAKLWELRSVRSAWTRKWIAGYFRYSGVTFLSATFKGINQHIDTVMIGLLTGPRTAGLYASIRQFLLPISFLSAPIATVSYPRFVISVAQVRTQEIREAIGTVNARLMLVSAGLGLVLLPSFYLYAGFADLAVDGRGYLAFLGLFIWAAVQSSLWWTRPFSSASRPALSLRANAATAILLAILFYPMVTYLGLIGAAASKLVVAIGLVLYWRHTLALATMRPGYSA